MTFSEYVINHFQFSPSWGLYALVTLAALLCLGAAVGGRTDP